MIEVIISNGSYWMRRNIKDALAKNPLTKHYTYNAGYGNDTTYETEHSYEFRTDPTVIKIFKELYPNGMPDTDELGKDDWNNILLECKEVDDEKYPYWYIDKDEYNKEFIRTDVLEKHGLK